jgi:putative transposase
MAAPHSSKLKEGGLSSFGFLLQVIHGQMRDELLDREIFTTMEEAKVLINQWRREYNQIRPHSAKNYQPPAPEAILTRKTK